MPRQKYCSDSSTLKTSPPNKSSLSVSVVATAEVEERCGAAQTTGVRNQLFGELREWGREEVFNRIMGQ